jgi:hypothetical protein
MAGMNAKDSRVGRRTLPCRHSVEGNLDTEKHETRLFLCASVASMLFGVFVTLDLRRDLAARQTHQTARCDSAAAHKLGLKGRWDQDAETCMVRLRFEDNVGPATTFYEQEVPLDQLPPPSA